MILCAFLSDPIWHNLWRDFEFWDLVDFSYDFLAKNPLRVVRMNFPDSSVRKLCLAESSWPAILEIWCFIKPYSRPSPRITRCRNHHSLTVFRHPLQELTLTTAHASLKPLEIGMPFKIRLFPPLNVQRMVWLGLPVWWELVANFPYHRWMNVTGHATSKNTVSD